MGPRVATLVALALLGACKGKARDGATASAARADAAMVASAPRDAAAAPLDASAPTAALTVEPARTYALPAPAPGFARIAAYDVDIQEGACKPMVTVLRAYEGLYAAMLAEQWKVEVTVGTLRLRCGGDPKDQACLAALCATLRPVPGGSALEPYPTEAPTLELATAGGFAGFDQGGVVIYADGTVQYFGPACARWRGRRGQLTAPAMAALMATVDQSGFATLAESPKEEMVRLLDCSDDVYASVSVRGTTRTVGCTRVKAIDDVAAAIRAAVFPNPCE
ncbi:MAG: hypothetical protein JNK64_06445 [Myxococcales bacterium]|nr:hypothetical protein [Myxococcales bacterium]